MTATVTVRPTVAALDASLFSPAGWFVIDQGNKRVPRVAVPSLAAGLGMVGRGPVATVVGRLRPQVRVVDVDVEGVRGHAITERVAAWLTQRGAWHLVRPSGGADGRAHVFTVPGPHLEQLEAFVEGLRAEQGLPYARLPILRTVRPLSAPHRRTGATLTPLGDLGALLSTLRTALPQPAAASGTETPAVAAASPQPKVAALRPPRRRRRPLPAQWQAYLDTGAIPALGGADHSPSTYALVCTGHLLRCGHDADTAWAAITTSHEAAFAGTKAKGRHWWVAHVWNHEVLQATRRADEADPPLPTLTEVDSLVEAARDTLAALSHTLGPRARHATLAVAHALLDRMRREQTLTVPCPLRNLQLDTGIGDRATVSTALRALQRAAFGRYNPDYDPEAKATSSHTFTLNERFTASTDRQALLELPPPVLHTPSAPTGTWRRLGAAAHTLWRALHRSAPAQTLVDLAGRAGFTHGPDLAPSAQQARTVKAHLIRLAGAGLARCDEHGHWSPGDTVSAEHSGSAAASYAQQGEVIAAERAAFRAGRTQGWLAGRAAALARQAKTDAARRQAWWDGKDPTERAAARGRMREAFRARSVNEQAEMKATLASRRVAAGLDEAARYRDWVDSQTDHELQRRSTEWSAWFARLPKPMQMARAAALREHRARFGLPRGTPMQLAGAEADALTGGRTGAAWRDRRYLEEQPAAPDTAPDLFDAV